MFNSIFLESYFLGRKRLSFFFFFLGRFLGRERVFFPFFLIASLVESVFSCFLTFLVFFINSHLWYFGQPIGSLDRGCLVEAVGKQYWRRTVSITDFPYLRPSLSLVSQILPFRETLPEPKILIRIEKRMGSQKDRKSIEK